MSDLLSRQEGEKGMTKAELMKLVGKKVHIYFKDGERGILQMTA